MYSSIGLAKKFIYYFCTASNRKGHGIHSPFVFDFIGHVLNHKATYSTPGEFRELRLQLLTDKRKIKRIELGAGSRKKHRDNQDVAHIAATALKPEKYAQLLFRLVKHYRPKIIIELGTSLGITTAYLAAANPDAFIYSIEGNPSVASIARENFEKLGLHHIHLLEGNFDQILPDVLQKLEKVDLAFIDGNHRYGPTMNYFYSLLKKAHADTILIMDDIHWSEEMENAWKEICSHPMVSYTIDVFFLGFVFFRKEFREKQNFTIRF